MKTILTGIALIIFDFFLSLYLTIPMFLFLLVVGVVIMAIGVVVELSNWRR
jgi:Na+/glutamate symporter